MQSDHVTSVRGLPHRWTIKLLGPHSVLGAGFQHVFVPPVSPVSLLMEDFSLQDSVRSAFITDPFFKDTQT